MATAKTMEELCTELTVLADKITRSISNGKRTGLEKRTHGFYENKIAELKRLWIEMDNVDTKLRTLIITSKTKCGHDYITNDIHGNTEEQYIKYLGDLTDGLARLNPSRSTDNSLNNSTIIHTSHSPNLLPRISLPKFNGEYSTWQSFRDLFVSVVDNDELLSSVQKLHHLKGCLIGEAERLLRHFPITNENYQPAWQTLVNRYENKRILVNTQLRILTNQPKITTETSNSIKLLMDTTNECLEQLKSLQVDVPSWDTLLIHLLVQKLPFVTLRLWEEELGDKQELPKYEQFQKFLQTRFRVLESMAQTVNNNKPITQNTKTYHVAQTNACPACGQHHFVGTCPKFLNMQVADRRRVIQNANRCFNCFSSKHMVTACKSIYRCKQCKKAHHSSLHIAERKGQKEEEISQKSTQRAITGKTIDVNRPGTSNNNTNEEKLQSFFTNAQNALLATAVVEAQTNTGQRITLRCLIDPGSQTSFVTKDTCKRLGLQGKSTKVKISGLNDSHTTYANQRVQLVLYSLYRKQAHLETNMLVIDNITGLLPPNIINTKQWYHLKGIKLADAHYWQPGSIDILLGASAYANILLQGLKRGPREAPIAIHTIFGWILMGNTHDVQDKQTQSFMITNCSEEQLNTQLKRFWEIEEVHTQPILSPDDQICEQIFKSTHRRLKNGQYEVQLPFKDQIPPTFGPSRHLALKRFATLKNKLSTNTKFKEEYTQCLDEYLKLGHMEKTNQHTNDNNEYYIPHHAVIKQSTTTRVRVVFDASAKSLNGKSLNDQLLVGPTIQPKLSTTLLRFRKHKIAMMADIEKMYRMILVHPKHRSYQKIIWEDPEKRTMENYQLCTLTFGTASAPFLAIRTLQQLGIDEADTFPLAAKTVKSEFYVDDMLTGADTVQEALTLQRECIDMLKRGHFNLRKWCSNNLEVLRAIPSEQREINGECWLEENDTIKTLGIKWSPAGDYFSFAINLDANNSIISKRKILSEVASLYDPLGWIAPVIIVAKILIQRLWISGCSWDSEVNENIRKDWTDFKLKLTALKSLKIPRWIGLSKNTSHIEIHGFCDASNKAYAAVVYLRNENNTVTLLTSKTKVAPIRPTTIPRLELNGALLLSKLLESTTKDLQQHCNTTVIAWTDSTVVLQWLKGHPSKWKTYVANRVAEIQDKIQPENWRYVPTADNPADVASRGSLADELENNRLWWHGPEWLAKGRHQWPTNPVISKQTTLETKGAQVVLHVTTTSHITERYSSFTKCIRIVALLKRFINNLQCNKERQTGTLTREELANAQVTIYKLIQLSAFPTEIKAMNNNEPLPKRSKLLNLNPLFDDNKLLRVGGRLEYADLPFDRKHPIILPAEHHFTNLIIDKTHIGTMHGGVGLVLNTTRNNYWILDAKRTIAKRINNCKVCITNRQRVRAQLMGNLPSCRVTMSKPFMHTGIDYAGPIILKTSPHRTPKTFKGYFCIYVCMATKAIHLELVSDMTSTAFIAALKRFVARRGLCKDIYSDCGTNFKGAQTKLKWDLHKAIKDSSGEIAQYLQSKDIVFHFNPPASPHFGGLWESGVKSVKYHLQRVIGKSIYTYEEYATILAQIEACVNSRPLCRIDNSTEDLEVLTPAHFLVGQTLHAIPEPIINDNVARLNSRWKHVQYVTQQFWDKWSKDYLNRLQQRPKWLGKQPNLKVGDVVLLKNESMPPTYWPMGIIEQTFPGQDGLVRVVQVKTTTSSFKRPISKICRLPVENPSNQNVPNS